MKRKISVCIFSFVALSFLPKAQNLVPNYSFEDTIKCASNVWQFSGYVNNWAGGGGALTYFSSQCKNGKQTGVPSNQFGFQYAHTGVSYGGMYTYIQDSAPNPSIDYNVRGYVMDTLSSVLKAGVRYYVTFYVSCSDSMNYACNDIGAYFSDSALKYTGYVKAYLTPQVANDPIKNPLIDTLNWAKVSGSFFASGGEQYIIIGNFKKDSASNTKHLGNISPNGTGAYYYIDDVIVSPDSNYADSLMAVQEVKMDKDKWKVYPNPANSILNIEAQLNNSEVQNICLYNAFGQQVKCVQLTNSKTIIPVSDLGQGIYMYRITDMQGNLIKADKVMLVR